MKLGEAITLKRGYDLPLDQRKQGPYPIVTSSGIAGHHHHFKAKGPGVVTGRTGTLGQVFYIPQDFWPHNTALYVKEFNENIPLYVFYLLQTLGFELRSAAAAVPTVNRNYLHLLPINLPSIEIQERIGRVLHNFNDLIENNRRRIHLLEEMVRALYREWFVHFRFPGYEEVETVDSELGEIPDGWDIKPFSEIADFLNGYAFKPKHWQKEGKLIVKIAEMKKGIGGSSSFYHGDDIPERYHIDTGHLLFAWSASLYITFWTDGPALLNQHIFDVIPREGFSKDFIYRALNDSMNRFNLLTQGATMQHIRRSALDDVCIVIPTPDILMQFDEIVGGLSQSFINLEIQNKSLKEARDLILPKLVSGQLDISNLELEIPQYSHKTSKHSDQSTLDQWLDENTEEK